MKSKAYYHTQATNNNVEMKMGMTFIRWIIALPLIVGTILFALAHPDSVSITWNPFEPAIELPLYFVSLLFLGTGFLLGAIMTWISMGKLRKERRAQRKIIKTLEKDLNKANEKIIDILSKKKTTQQEQKNIQTLSHTTIEDTEKE